VFKRFCFIVSLLISFFSLAVLPALANMLVDTAWVRRYNGPADCEDVAHAIATDDSGNVYVTGQSQDATCDDYDYVTMKYDPSGSQLWVQRYDGPGNSNDGASAIAVDGSGNVYVTGYSVGSGTNYDYTTIKYDHNGNQLWVQGYNGPGNDWDRAWAIAVDGSGNVNITGYSYGTAGGAMNSDYATIKYSSFGNQLWVQRYNGPTNGDDYAYAIATDGSGNVYITGTSWGGWGSDYCTIKYSPNGNQLWVKRYNGPGNSNDDAFAVAVDGSGNVYVTGRSMGSGTIYDYATIKYDTDGNELWAKRYNGPGDSWDWARTIAVDGSGNVYVTGYSIGSGTYEDYATIKYDNNGNELWVKRYNGPGNNRDDACAIALDGSGNVYVTGVSFGSGTSFDYATIKYDNNGNELWVKRYNGPGNGTDNACDIAVDGSGNVYVTGGSNSSSSDYATIKYFQCLCGDANQDAIVDIGDVVYLINYVFYSGAEPLSNSRCNDVNTDGVVDIGDIVYLINYVFYGGAEPNCQ
jgi:hypothetical protein